MNHKVWIMNWGSPAWFALHSFVNWCDSECRSDEFRNTSASTVIPPLLSCTRVANVLINVSLPCRSFFFFLSAGDWFIHPDSVWLRLLKIPFFCVSRFVSPSTSDVTKADLVDSSLAAPASVCQQQRFCHHGNSCHAPRGRLLTWPQRRLSCDAGRPIAVSLSRRSAAATAVTTKGSSWLLKSNAHVHQSCSTKSQLSF